MNRHPSCNDPKDLVLKWDVVYETFSLSLFLLFNLFMAFAAPRWRSCRLTLRPVLLESIEYDWFSLIFYSLCPAARDALKTLYFSIYLQLYQIVGSGLQFLSV